MDPQGLRRRWIPIAVLAVGLLCTTGVAWQTWRAHCAAEGERFALSVHQTRAEISKRLATCVAMLRATAGLFAASEYVTSDEFHRFVDQLDLQTAYPGITAIGFSQRSTRPELLEHRIRSELEDSSVLHPQGERSEYHATIYIEPLNARSRAAIGYDMFTDPVCRFAMERARDQGEAVASGPVKLTMNPEDGQIGFVIYFPVYEGGQLPPGINQRREYLVGFVHAPIRAEALLESLFPGGKPPVEFRVNDAGPVGEEVTVFKSAGFERARPDSQEMVSEQTLEVSGRVWRIRALPGEAFAAGEPLNAAPLVASVGTLISLMLFGLTRAQTEAAARSERTALKLRESEARKGAILESALDAIISMDHEGRITEWNPAAERTFGYTREQAVGKDLAALIIPASSREAHRAGLARTLQSSDGGLLGRRVEITALHADGTEFPVEFSISRIGTSEPPRFTGFVRDISERARAERHQVLMTRELDHRVKNNLSTVIAILGESARRSESVEDLVRSATGRIRALAGLHEMLASRRWQGAEVGELIRRTLAPYQAEGRGRVTFSGEPLTLPGRSASSLCMAIHELATNASKYGALSAEGGSVVVSWRREDRGEAGRWLVLSWEERGGPPVRTPDHRGFGSELIEGGISFETGGFSTMTFAPTGLVCTIEMPCEEPAPGTPGQPGW